MRKFYVYIYCHPDTGIPFYVGKGSAGRYKKHLTNARNPHLRNKINKLNREGKEPMIDVVLRTDDEGLAYDIEENLIRQYKRSCDGGVLCNQDLGTRGSKIYDFDDEFFELLGKYSDNEISRRYGCSYSIVRHYRDSLGIPPAERGRAHNSKLNILSEDQLEELINKVGKEPDKPLAREFNVSHSTIKVLRDELGIPAFMKINQIDDALLGTVPDKELAKKYNCSTNVVYKRRKKLNIPPYDGGRNRPVTKKPAYVFYNGVNIYKCSAEAFARFVGLTVGSVKRLIKGDSNKTRCGWYYVGTNISEASL